MKVKNVTVKEILENKEIKGIDIMTPYGYFKAKSDKFAGILNGSSKAFVNAGCSETYSEVESSLLNMKVENYHIENGIAYGII